MALKNIILITDECGVTGGGPKVPLFEANYLSRFYNVVFFCGNVATTEGINNNIKIISVYKTTFFADKNKLRGALRGIYSFKAKRMLKKLLSQYSPEDTVIHIHGFVSSLSSSIFKPIYKSKIPVFYTLHAYHLICPNGGFFNYKKLQICNLKPCSLKCKFTNCDSRALLYKIYRTIRKTVENHNVKVGKNNIHYIFLSQLSYSKLIDYLKPQTEYRFIHNPIESRNVSVTNINSNKEYLFVGRVTKEKGIIELCEHANQKGIILNIVGSGALLKELKAKYFENKNIIFHGWQNFDYINNIMLRSRALIFPSLWYECEPLTVLEAKSAGLPILVSKLCASVEDITEKSGIIYDPRNYDEFSKAIDILNSTQIIEMSRHSKEEFEKYEKINNHFEQLQQFYKDVIDGNSNNQ